MKNRKQREYATGLRFLKAWNIVKDQEINRVDVALFRILEEGPQEVSANLEQQWSFSFHPESITPKQIAHCLRSIAYKIGRINERRGEET